MAAVSELEAAVAHLARRDPGNSDPADLARLLYAVWYAPPTAPPRTPVGFPADLVQVLRAADATATTWQPGWTTLRVAPDGRVIARRNGEVRMAERSDYVADNHPATLPGPGDPLTLAGRRDRHDADGWWRTGGSGWQFTRTPPALVRLFWSPDLAHLPTLVSLLTERLAREPRPWLLKCAADPALHSRADATVLYLTANLLTDVARDLTRMAEGLGQYCRETAPPLTLRVVRGLAAAVDPGGGESFGEHRCRLIAEALAEQPDARGEVALRLVAARFAADGIDFERPYARRSDGRLPWEA